MSLQGVLPFVLDFSAERPIEVEVSQAQLTGEAGLLPIRQFDEAIRWTARFAAALGDAHGGEVLHSNLSMVRQRIDGILADYEDQNDHDTLRSDPAFKLVCGRLPNGLDQPAGLARQSHCRLRRVHRARRITDHRFLANFFRRYLHAASLNLLVRWRRATARPITVNLTDLNRSVPPEVLAGRDRHSWFNRRRQHDPLGEGFACTWCQRLIKAAAEITVSARRVLVRLSANWPFADEYRRISQAVLAHPRSP